MKRLFLLLSFIVGFLFLPVAVTFAASLVGEAVFDKEGIELYFYSLGALSGAVIALTQFVKKLLKVDGDSIRWLSWVIALVVSFVGWWLELGMLAGLSWLWVVAYGVFAGLLSNSLFDASQLEAILRLFKQKKEQ